LARRAASIAAAVLIGVGSSLALSGSAHAATTQLCQEQTAPAAGGVYNVQNDEWGSGAAECISTDGGTDFTVGSSGIDNATNGAPGAYPSIYQGCHFGVCTSGGLTSTPVQVSSLTAGKVTTSWSTTQPGGSSDYDVAYDVWFNSAPTTTSQPNCTELMVWLNHNGPVQPFGTQKATGVTVGGNSYNVWEGQQWFGDTVSYTMTTPATSVSNLDFAPIAQDAVSRGYLSASCYLIDVEAGFEVWQGGAGLATNSFSVDVNGAAPVPPSCSVSYQLEGSSNGSMQANVILTDTGNSPLNGWQLNWTFPGDTKITSMWAGVYSQSGAAVTVNNASYDGSIAPGASAEIGFNGTYTSNDAAPTGITCT
jgi:cellulose 1,4-beta-cellobiosidase